MVAVNINLSFDGTCEEAFIFYHTVFGGEPVFTRYKDMPKSMPVAAVDRKRVAHAVLPLGGMSLMGSDVPYRYKLDRGKEYSICLSPKNLKQAKEITAKLSDGGSVAIPPGETFWSEYYAVFTDRFGINWIVNFEGEKKEQEKLPKARTAKRAVKKTVHA